MTQKEYDKYMETNVNENLRNKFNKYIYAMLEIEGEDISSIREIIFDNKTLETKIIYHE